MSDQPVLDLSAPSRDYGDGMDLSEGRAPRAAADGFQVAVGEDGVAVLTIDRPERRNALTWQMWSAMPQMLAGLAADAGVRVLLVTGAGAHFSAGADLHELSEVYGEAGRARSYHETNVIAETALAAFPRPTIAVVNGSCVGGGCQLAVACDLRIAADTARFGLTPAKLGVVYPVEPTARLARLVGPARAKYLLFTADIIGAARALELGLADEVVPEASLAERALALGATIAGRSPQSVGAAKSVIDAIAAGRNPSMAIGPWQHWHDDVREGIAAFIDGRTPTFVDPS
jgi:enoyl-CoA hydratase/carnithine racemase